MIEFDLKFIYQTTNPSIAKAMEMIQLGYYQWASDEVDRAALYRSLIEDDDQLRLEFIKRKIRQLSGPTYGGSVQLRWHVAPTCWERDWIMFLLRRLQIEEIDCHQNIKEPYEQYCIVVDNQLSKEKSDDYKMAFQKGCRICLIHLSDEYYRDDFTAYQWCELVYRNYHSPILSAWSSVKSLPLGYKSGFVIDRFGTPSSRREYKWGFAGDVNKSARLEMLSSMSELGLGHRHTTSGFAAADALSTGDYQEFMTRIMFAPCPAGFQNLDSFRVYEALECGAIPILETRNGYDYFFHLLGPHPMLTVSRWSDAPSMVRQLESDELIDRLQLDCWEWWMKKKNSVAARLCSDILCM